MIVTNTGKAPITLWQNWKGKDKITDRPTAVRIDAGQKIEVDDSLKACVSQYRALMVEKPAASSSKGGAK